MGLASQVHELHLLVKYTFSQVGGEINHNFSNRLMEKAIYVKN